MVIAFHKPYGVLCQFTPDQPGQRTLAEYSFPPDVYPVGRLDMDSEGLLLLTDEAGFNHRLLDPKTAHPRTYLSQVEGVPDEGALAMLRRGGLSIQGYRTRPCAVERVEADPGIAPRVPPIRVRQSVPDSWLRLTLIEGKNRQVRRMTAAVGYPTLRLIRVGIGGLELAGLDAGAWRILTSEEVRSVWKR